MHFADKSTSEIDIVRAALLAPLCLATEVEGEGIGFCHREPFFATRFGAHSSILSDASEGATLVDDAVNATAEVDEEQERDEVKKAFHDVRTA